MKIKKFLACESGNYTIATAVTVVPLMAAVMGVTDLSMSTTQKTNAQAALDSAAIAIAINTNKGKSEEELEAIGLKVFEANLKHDANLDATFEFPGVTHDDSGLPEFDGSTYVTVMAPFRANSLFNLSRGASTTLVSKVTIMPGDPACVVSLSASASPAIRLWGSTEVELDGCAMAANSSADEAIKRGGNAKLKAECVSTVGGTSGIDSSSRVDLECSASIEGAMAVVDPLAGMSAPANGACKSLPTGNANTVKTLQPGTYCNKNISGNYILQPGTYILDGGEIDIGNNDTFTGAGVTIFLKNDASVSFGANAIVTLSAPTSGTYAGILFFSDRGNTATLDFGGGALTTLAGYIYAPDGHVEFAGNSTAGGNACIRIAASTVNMTGNTGLKADCSAVFGSLDMTLAGNIRFIQ